MQVIDKINYRLPVWCICPIVNDDYSSLNDADIQALENFMEETCEVIENTGQDNHGTWDWPNNIDEATYFSHTNDVDSLGNDVIDVDLIIFGKK